MMLPGPQDAAESSPPSSIMASFCSLGRHSDDACVLLCLVGVGALCWSFLDAAAVALPRG